MSLQVTASKVLVLDRIGQVTASKVLVLNRIGRERRELRAPELEPSRCDWQRTSNSQAECVMDGAEKQHPVRTQRRTRLSGQTNHELGMNDIVNTKPERLSPAWAGSRELQHGRAGSSRRILSMP